MHNNFKNMINKFYICKTYNVKNYDDSTLTISVFKIGKVRV